MSSEQEATLATTALAGQLTGPAHTGTAAGVAHSLTLASAAAPQEQVTPRVRSCANCGAEVVRKFCGDCGQKHEHALHSIWHFTREVTENLTHADSRLWSTMPALLFKPGFLTREFIAGKRVRYLPPLRLYLVLSVVFFVVLGTREHKPVAITAGDKGIAALQLKRPDQIEDLAAKPGETTEQRVERVCDPQYHGPLRSFVTPFLQKGCRLYVEDKTPLVAEAFIHTLPKAMFIFLPLLALAMKPLYWRPRRYYIEHVLFFLHNHAFGFLLFTLLMLVPRFAPPGIGHWVTIIASLYLPYYLFVSMRRVYGQSRWMTSLKLAVLAFAYFIGGAITLALTGVYSVYTG